MKNVHEDTTLYLQVFQALAKDSENAKDESQKEFGQEIPANKPWEKPSGPPILPPHLLQVILNKDTPLSVNIYLIVLLSMFVLNLYTTQSLDLNRSAVIYCIKI